MLRTTLHRCAPLCTVLLLTACASVSLAPGAADVVVTRDPLVVRSCRSLGEVSIPYGGVKLAKNAGAAIDADTVLITTSKWYGVGYVYSPPPPAQGIAYRCSKGPG